MKVTEPNIAKFLKARREAMGLIPSGLYGYYSEKVDSGDIYGADGRMLIERIAAMKPSRVVHVGIGIGVVTLALAAKGIPCIGYDWDHVRLECAQALQDGFGVSYELQHALYPDADESTGGLLLFMNVLGSSWNAEAERATIDTFDRFDRVILDLSRFGKVRDDDASRDELLGRIAPDSTTPLGVSRYVELAPGAAYIGDRAAKAFFPADKPNAVRAAARGAKR